MRTLKPYLIGLALFSLSTAILPHPATASTIATQWFFGNWDCLIDGRPAQMQWSVVNNPQTQCNGDVCSTTSGVKLVGRFSDSRSPWVNLSKQWSNRSELGIRYLGREQDNWYLRQDSRTKIATGWTTWRGNRYPLQCHPR